MLAAFKMNESAIQYVVLLLHIDKKFVLVAADNNYKKIVLAASR